MMIGAAIALGVLIVLMGGFGIYVAGAGQKRNQPEREDGRD